MMHRCAAFLCLLHLSATAVHAEDSREGCPKPEVTSADKSRYTLFRPTPVALLREMSTDRPDTTESPVTVDAGHFQIESSLVDYSRERSRGVTRETWCVGPTNLKVGLLDRTDLQLILEPYTVSKTGGVSGKREGVSDLTVRLKQNLWGNEGDRGSAFALMPWVSAPTGGDDLSAGRYEGGLIAPLSVAVTEGVSASVMLEADVLWDEARQKYFVAWTHTAACGFDVTEKLGLYVEYVGVTDSGGASPYRSSANVGLTYAFTANLVADGGIRVGLNSRADDLGVFTGVSYRH